MKKIKLFPKIFLYTFAIMSFLIIISHLLIYFIFPITYLENRKDSIKNTADILAESIDGLDKSFINKYLELFSKNNEVKVFIKNGAIDNEVNLENKIDINLDSENNSVIIEERSVKTREDENLVLYFVTSKDMKREAKNISLSFLPYTLIVSFIFLIGGIAMLVFTLLVGIPSIKQSAEVCTLEVEAIVIDNKSDLKSDSDYGQSYRYNQVVEYVVEDKKIQTTIHNLTSDPVPEGTKITLWVDPENPYIYTNNRDIKPTTIIVPIAIPIGIMLFGVLGLVFNLKKEK